MREPRETASGKAGHPAHRGKRSKNRLDSGHFGKADPEGRLGTWMSHHAGAELAFVQEEDACALRDRPSPRTFSRTARARYRASLRARARAINSPLDERRAPGSPGRSKGE